MTPPEPNTVALDATDAGAEIKGRSLWSDAGYRLLQNKAAVVSGMSRAFVMRHECQTSSAMTPSGDSG